MKLRLQSYGNGAIFKLGMNSYSVEVDGVNGYGSSPAEALEDFSSKLNQPKKRTRKVIVQNKSRSKKVKVKPCSFC